MPAAGSAPPGLTFRAIGLALVMIVLIAWWVAASEIRTGTTEITCTSLPIGVVFVLFCLCLANAAVRRYWPRRALAGTELAVIYLLTAVGSAACGIGLIANMFTAVLFTRMVFDYWLSRANVQRLSI